MSEVLSAISETLEKSPVVRALLGILVPHFEPVSDAIVERHRRKLFVKWAAELNDDPDVTAEEIAADDKLFAAFAVAGCVTRAHSKDRISYFARLYANFLAGRGISSPSEFSEFLYLLESLSEREFLILLRLRSIAENTMGIHLGSNELLFGWQPAWTKLRIELASELNLSEPEIDSIVQGLTRTGFCRVLLGRNGDLASACATGRLDKFLQALTKYDRTGIPKPPTIPVGPYVG